MKNGKMMLNAALYVINNILTKAFQFFLVPIYTAYLTTAEYGTSNLITNFSLIGCVLISLSVNSATSRLYIEYKADQKRAGVLFGTLYIFTALFGLVGCGALFLCGEYLSRYVFSGVDFFPLIATVIASVWVQSVANQYKAILQAVQNAKTYTFISLSSFTVQLAINIYLVVVCNMGVMGIVFGALLSNLMVILYGIYDLCRARMIVFKLDLKIIYEALKYAVPLIPHSLSSSIAQLLSRIFIGNSHTLSAVGLYGLAGQFGHIVDTVQGSVHSAYLPWFFEQISTSKENAIQKVREVLPMMLSIYNLFFLGVALFSQEAICLVAATDYYDAWKMIPLFVLEYAIKTPYYFYVSFLFYNQAKAKFIFQASITSNFFNIILAAFLVPRLGPYGAIVADIAAIIVQLCIIVKMCNGEEKEYFRYSQFLKSTVQLVIVAVIGLVPAYLSSTRGFLWPLFMGKILLWLTCTLWTAARYISALRGLLFKLKEKF